MIESLSVTVAPSGHILSALVFGTIAFTAELSGVPDLNVSLTTVGGQQAIAQKIQLPAFHPCVRLARWRERPGELSFIPPDGDFILAGYEVDLLPTAPNLDTPPNHMEKIFLPAMVDIRKSLGTTGSEFEVRLTLNADFPGFPPSARSGRPTAGGRSNTSTPSFLGGGGGNTSGPSLEEVVVTIPISKSVRNITEMQPSRGDVRYSPGSDVLEWHVPTSSKEAKTVSGVATLRCAVAGYNYSTQNDFDDDNEISDLEANQNLLQGYYDESNPSQYPETNLHGSGHPTKRKTKKKKKKKATTTTSKKSRPTTVAAEELGVAGGSGSTPASGSGSPSPIPSKPQTPTIPETTARVSSPSRAPSIFRPTGRKSKAQLNASLMPSSASVSFAVRGWLPSGIKVESVTIDPRRSRGLGEGVRPFKGVKYLCISRRGVERRC